MKPFFAFFLFFLSGLAVSAAFARPPGQAVGFVETFALADDREEALRQLVPGSADYYYYHCLHHQHGGRLDQVDKMLAAWRERHRGDDRIEIIANRQAVLLYDDQPGEALDRLRHRLGLTFPHQRERDDQRTRGVTSLDPELVSRQVFFHHALRRSRSSVAAFSPTAYEWLINADIGPERRRDLLRRLQRPDFPGLVRHVAADLRWQRSRGFGQHPVHGMMTLRQLEELRREIPALANDDTYIRTVLGKLRPGPETDIEFDLEARRDYLERLWDFVGQLPGGQNSVKAHVLYHRLELDRRQGRFDPGRFDTYVRLPRYLPYVNEDWIQPLRRQDQVLDLRADYREATGLPPVGNDEPLVRSYLLHLLRGADDFSRYASYIRERYLREVMAEANLLAGAGDAERWYSMLTPRQVQALRDRVDLDFAPENRQEFLPGEPVKLDVLVKNVDQLEVRVYRVNALNVYRHLGREIDTGLDLDGLEPGFSRAKVYYEAPIRRVRRSFAFPEIDRPGVYIVDLIGNGRGSRALLRIGGLSYTMDHGPAGHLFRLYDERQRPVGDGAVHLGNHRYPADEEGAITVPYSTDPGRRAIILEGNGRFALDRFEHAAEEYQLLLGAYVERESLIAHETAPIILRPELRLNGNRLPAGLLEDVSLTLTATDLDGLASTKVIDAPDFVRGDEMVHQFRVPPRLRNLRLDLEAVIKTAGGGEERRLLAVHELAINAIAGTPRVAMPLLTRDGSEHIVEIRGRNGEPLPGHGVSLQVRHRDFTFSRDFSLQTDEQGRIGLGRLDDISSLTVSTARGASRTWTLDAPSNSYPAVMTVGAGGSLHLPWPAAAGALSRSSAGLHEMTGGTYAADKFDHLAGEDGYLVVSGLPPGDYQLVLKRDETRIDIHVGGDTAHGGNLLSGQRSVEAAETRLPGLRSLEVDGGDLLIRLGNVTDTTRVHLVATHFAAAFDPLAALHLPGRPHPRVERLPRHGSVYVSGRDIGEEYRYVLDRRGAPRFPGTLQSRPGLLLHPWARRETETGLREAAAGDAFAARRREVPRRPQPSAPRPAVFRSEPPREDLADLDFIDRPAVVLANQRPDDEGNLAVALDSFAHGGWVRVIVTDGDFVATGEYALSRPELPRRERRLARALDPAGGFLQRRAVTACRAGDEILFDDPTAADIQVYDSLADVFRLFATLAGEEEGDDAGKLARFRFLARWPGLDQAGRERLYSRYASHELNFFLYHRDRAFFDRVVRPHLANKKDKTFMDNYLLGADLRPYRESWRVSRLNMAERILLGRRLDQAATMARHVEDRLALSPPSIETENRLFDIALLGGAMEPDAAAAPFARPAEKAFAPGLTALAEGVRGRAAAPPSRMMEAEAAEDALNGVLADRRRVRALFQDVAPTSEWAENNYYHLPLEEQNADLIKANPFWLDFARHDPTAPFRSGHFAHASANFSEMMLALALLDLPFAGGEHTFDRDGTGVRWRAGSPAIVFSRRVEPAAQIDDGRPVLVSQTVFRPGGQAGISGEDAADDSITEGFVAGEVYGLRMILTNPGSVPLRVDLLGQVPEGAIPLAGHRATVGRHLRLEPFATSAIETIFYFPQPGEYSHYPVHAGIKGRLVAAAEPVRFTVAGEAPGPDTGSWDHVSQDGSLQEVLEFLRRHNVEDVNLSRIAWRMRDRESFIQVTELLDRRHAYDDVLWSYGLLHDHLPAIQQYLLFHSFADACGDWLDSTLLPLDPVERRSYQHLEYAPLVNARAHALGGEAYIVNESVRRQYLALLGVLAHRPRLNDGDRMALVYYLLLQDRIAEALDHFARIEPEALPCRLQYDAFAVHLAFFTADYQRVQTIAARYVDYPVKRWAERFRDALDSLAAAGLGPEAPVLPEMRAGEADRDRRMDRLAATDPSLEFEVSDDRIILSYDNLDQVTVNIYRMDIELLFSGDPFARDYGERFSFVQPERGLPLSLDPEQRTQVMELAADLRRRNLMIEVLGAGLRRSQVVLSSALAVRMVENYGRLSVADRESGAPLPGVYIKAYARMADGTVRFHKDGYTDLRGQFDYATVSGPTEGGGVDRFAILVLCDTQGAVIREAAPPSR